VKPRFSPAALTLALLVDASAASAQPRDASLAATRRDLIDQARAARTAGDHARALDLAQRAGQIEMSLSLRRFLSEEQESLGRVADAMNNAETCVREGGSARDNAPHVDACRAITGRLQARVGRVTVTAPTPAPAGLRVRVAGNEVPSVVWGVPLLVTPGPVTIDAEAPMFRPFHRDVTVGVERIEPVAITLEALPPTPIAAPSPAVAVAPVAAPAPAPVINVAPVQLPSAAGAGAGPFVLMGVGALGLGGALAFLAVAAGDSGEPCADAPSTLCESASAGTFRTLGWVSLGVGVSAAIGGVVWFFLGRSSGAPPPRATLTGAPLPGGATLGVRLVF
jgi:hypothetical protein